MNMRTEKATMLTLTNEGDRIVLDCGTITIEASYCGPIRIRLSIPEDTEQDNYSGMSVADGINKLLLFDLNAKLVTDVMELEDEGWEGGRSVRCLGSVSSQGLDDIVFLEATQEAPII